MPVEDLWRLSTTWFGADCLSVGLGVNLSKTTFRRKFNYKQKRGNLGVTLDIKLLGGRHVEEVAGKATRALIRRRESYGNTDHESFMIIDYPHDGCLGRENCNGHAKNALKSAENGVHLYH